MAYNNPNIMDKIFEPVFGLFYSSRYSSFIRYMDIAGTENIFEFGCGSGQLTRRLARRLEGGGHITSIDIAPYWIGKMRKKLGAESRVTIILGDLLGIDPGKGQYDLVFVHYVLHDIARFNRYAYVVALSSLLREGGRLCICEPTKASHGMPAFEIRDLMEKCGLEKRDSGYGINGVKSDFSATFVRPAQKS